ncbi:TonB-dependent receptor [bacterium]|nr:TonB-dependent receptor [bacterium]
MRTVWILALAVFVSLQGVSAQDLSGTVRDARTGSPLPAANVVLSPAGNAPTGKAPTGKAPMGRGMPTDRSGQFLFEDLDAGTYTVRVSYVGYSTFEQEISISGDRLLNIRLQAKPMPGPEIEISAMKARERFSPVTFSELKREDLESEYFVQDIPVMLSDLPSVTYYSEGGSGLGYNYLRIRGFDQRRLAVMVNGVPQNDPEDHNVYWIDFVDLLGNTEEIQVQRGAGSAFYGPPAIGGSINIVTGDFANRKGITVSSGAGSYNTQRFALAVGSGLVDDTYTFFGRLSSMSTDGYRDHSYMKASSYYFAATRYDENFTTRINAYGGPLEDGLVYYGLPKFAIENRDLRRANYNYWEAEDGEYTWTSPRRKQEHEKFSQPHFELLNEWKASDALTFNSALFYVIGQGYFDYDGTGWTDAAYYRLTTEYGFENAGDPLNPIIRAYVDNRQVGWLPRMTLQHDGGTMTAGLELRYHRSEHWGRIESAGGLPAELDPSRHYYEYRGGKNIAAAYVQEQLQLTDRINLMGNIQYVFNRYKLFDEKYVGTSFDVDYHFINPRLGINVNLDPSWNVYGNVSYTHREPRLKNLYDAAESSGGTTPQFAQLADGRYDFNNPQVKPEKLLNFELGTGFIGERHQILLNGYFMDFEDEIIKSGGLDRFGQPITGNADQTLHMGIEVVARYQLLRSLMIEANGMFSRSRLEKYTVFDTDGNGAALPIELDGNRIAGFPEQLANLKLTWRRYGFTTVLTLKYVGDQYTDNFEGKYYSDAYDGRGHVVDPYTVLNASLGYRTPPVLGFRAVDLRLAVNNLLDRLYAQSGEGNQFFVAAERNFFFDIQVHL